MYRLTVLLPLLAAAACAPTATQMAPAQSAAVAPVAVAQASVGGKKICRRDDELGTLMPKRTCKTAEEWAAIDAQNQQNAQRTFDNAPAARVSQEN